MLFSRSPYTVVTGGLDVYKNDYFFFRICGKSFTRPVIKVCVCVYNALYITSWRLAYVKRLNLNGCSSSNYCIIVRRRSCRVPPSDRRRVSGWYFYLKGGNAPQNRPKTCQNFITRRIYSAVYYIIVFLLAKFYWPNFGEKLDYTIRVYIYIYYIYG